MTTSKKFTPNNFSPSLFLISFLLVLQWSACSVLDKDEPIPGYYFVGEFTLSTPSDNSQGTDAHDIRDVWIEVNGKAIGVFEVPVTIPIIYDKDTNIIIVRAGIKNNGLADKRIAYPFYTLIRDTVVRRDNQIDSIFPMVSYVSGAEFPWLEDFEDRSISMEQSGNDVTIDSIGLTSDPDLVFGYNSKNLYSAVVDLDTGKQYFERSSIPTFDFPRGRAIYLEINYRCDTYAQIGLVVTNNGVLVDQIPVLLLYPNPEGWKKAYISLGEDVNNSKYAGNDFKVFLAAENNGKLDHPKLYIDNIKVIHQ
jgi:hypothetical protein